MADHCAWYLKTLGPVKDWAAAAKLQAPTGWITAIDGRTGAVQWQYHAESQVLAGLVPTKSGLLFGGDTHGNLLVFDAAKGSVLKQIDTGGALNSGLISYLAGVCNMSPPRPEGRPRIPAPSPGRCGHRLQPSWQRQAKGGHPGPPGAFSVPGTQWDDNLGEPVALRAELHPMPRRDRRGFERPADHPPEPAGRP